MSENEAQKLRTAEPEECAIIFFIFAVVFVIVYRYFQKKGEQKS